MQNSFGFILRLFSHIQGEALDGHVESDSGQQHKQRVGSIRHLLARRCRGVVQVKSSTLEDSRDRSTQGTKCTCCHREAALPIDLANGPLGQATFHKWTAYAICKAVQYTG